MRTTVELNDHLLRQAKERAASEGRPLRAVIEDALRNLLQASPSSDTAYKLEWHTEKGRVREGVRLDDRQSLYDLMEGR